MYSKFLGSSFRALNSLEDLLLEEAVAQVGPEDQEEDGHDHQVHELDLGTALLLQLVVHRQRVVWF